MDISTDAKVGIGITVLTLVIILGGAFLASKKQTTSSTPTAEVTQPEKLNRQDGTAAKTGSDQPQVTFVEFADFQCPACGAFYPITRQLKETFKDKPVQFVYRNFPLTQIHEHAQLAAEAGEAARVQGKFWEYHNVLFENQTHLEQSDLERYAEQVGLDMEKFRSALNNHEYTGVIKSDIADGRALGVQGTPTIFINNKEYTGNRSVQAITDYINSLLPDEQN